MTVKFTKKDWQSIREGVQKGTQIAYQKYRRLIVPTCIFAYFLLGNSMTFQWEGQEFDWTAYHVQAEKWLFGTLVELNYPETDYLNNPSNEEVWNDSPSKKHTDELWEEYQVVQTSISEKRQQPRAKQTSQKTKMWADDGNLMNTYSNLGFSEKSAYKGTKKKSSKRQKQLRYVDRFAKVAQTEMEKYGIPASITLAQGLLESNVGESRLARQCNNHFGMKCFSKKCGKGHCMNFTDDSHKDFFRKYGTAWESFRAHSKLLQAKRYRRLYALNKKDYKGWARGLKKAGYATDPRYAEKLIGLIEELKLYQYD